MVLRTRYGKRTLKYRPQRGGLAESMTQVADISPNLAALTKHINDLGWFWYPIHSDQVKVIHQGFDARINWDTYIVMVDGQAVGFTDGPCTESKQ